LRNEFRILVGKPEEKGREGKNLVGVDDIMIILKWCVRIRARFI
jgi:hypothetical protein